MVGVLPTYRFRQILLGISKKEGRKQPFIYAREADEQTYFGVLEDGILEGARHFILRSTYGYRRVVGAA